MRTDKSALRIETARTAIERRRRRCRAETFIGRFLLHVLPPGFMRIRHYGFLANRAKKTCLAQCREQLHASAPKPLEPKTVADWMMELTGVDVTRCPHCGAPLESEELLPELPCPGKSSLSWDTS